MADEGHCRLRRAAKRGSLLLTSVACCIHWGAGCDPFTSNTPAEDAGADARIDGGAVDDSAAPEADAGASDARRSDQRFVFISEAVAADFAGDASVDDAATRICEKSVDQAIATLGRDGPAAVLVNRAWRGWLSDAQRNAVDRVTPRGGFEWVNVNGEVVFAKGTLGDPATAVPARAFLTASADPYNGFVWTGTVQDGTALSNGACNSWRSTVEPHRGVVGSAMLRDAAAWSLDNVVPCGGSRPIYCFEVVP